MVRFHKGAGPWQVFREEGHQERVQPREVQLLTGQDRRGIGSEPCLPGRCTAQFQEAQDIGLHTGG